MSQLNINQKQNEISDNFLDPTALFKDLNFENGNTGELLKRTLIIISETKNNHDKF